MPEVLEAMIQKRMISHESVRTLHNALIKPTEEFKPVVVSGGQLGTYEFNSKTVLPGHTAIHSQVRFAVQDAKKLGLVHEEFAGTFSINTEWLERIKEYMKIHP